MKKILSLLFISGILSSCASTEDTLAMYRSYDERKLCMSFFMHPRSNIWQETRLQVIREKNYDCNKYIAEAQLRLGQDILSKID